MRSLFFFLAMISTQALASPLLSSSDIVELKHDNLNRGFELSTFVYHLPNGAVGHCKEGNGQGLYSVTRNRIGGIHAVDYTCTIEIIRASELSKVTRLTQSSFFAAFPWDLRKVKDDERRFDQFNELGAYHRKLEQEEGFIRALVYGYRPYMDHSYEGAYDLSDGIFHAKISLHCSTLEGFPAVENDCSEARLLEIATKLSRDPSKGDTIRAVGIIGY